MKNIKKILFYMFVFLLLDYIIILGLGSFIHVNDWISRNGYEVYGVCVNHFGETYNCHIQEWMIRIFSPFSCIPYAMIMYSVVTGICLVIVVAKQKLQ